MFIPSFDFGGRSRRVSVIKLLLFQIKPFGSVHCDNINRLLIFRENMPHLTLIRLTSRLRPLETNGKLPFSLPSLSATEKAYIWNSLEVCEVGVKIYLKC